MVVAPVAYCASLATSVFCYEPLLASLGFLPTHLWEIFSAYLAITWFFHCIVLGLRLVIYLTDGALHHLLVQVYVLVHVLFHFLMFGETPRGDVLDHTCGILGHIGNAGGHGN